MKADVFATFQLVAQLDLDAIPLVAANRQRLNPLGLHTGNHRARIKAFLVARFPILRFFRPNLVEIFIQRVHVAGIKIEPLVQRDLDVDRRHVVLLDRRRGRALPASRQCHWLHSWVGHQQEILTACPILVHHGLGIEHTRIDLLRLRIMSQMLHDPLVLLLNHRRALRLSGHRIFDNRLPLQLLRPRRELMGHRCLLRRRMVHMRLSFSRCG